MSFTNADKKKLDDILALDQTTIVSMHVGTLKGIFARMEAGENCLLTHSIRSDCKPNESDIKAFDAWRKECGEPDPEKLCNSCAIGSMEPCTCRGERK